MFRSFMVRQSTCALVLGLLVAPGSVHAATPPAESPVTSPLADPAGTLTGKKGGLTAEGLATRATDTSPTAARQRQEVEAAEAQLQKASYDFIPRLSGTAAVARLSPVNNSLGTVVASPGAQPGPVDPNSLVVVPLELRSKPSSVSLASSLNVPVSDYMLRFFQAHAGAKAQLKASRWSLQAATRKVDYDARSLYYGWVGAELDHAVAEQHLELSREHLQRVQALLSAESASEADVARVQASLAKSESTVVETGNNVLLQRQRIRIALHDPSAPDFEIGEDLRVTPSPRPELDNLAQLIDVAARSRAEIRALEQQGRAYEKQADAAYAQALPRLDGFFQLTLANPNSRYLVQDDKYHSSWQLGLQLSYSPNDSLSGSTQIASLRARERAAEEQRNEALDALRADVTSAVLSHRNAIANLDTSQRRLTAAETSYRARRELYQVGRATTVELTEAQTELYNAKLDAVRAQVAIRLARVRILYVTGQDG